MNTSASGTPVRVRRSIEDIQQDYNAGNKKPLEDVVRAWKGIQELPPTDPRSFFVLGGYHGEPFRGAGWGSPEYWGGYCNHGNVLFPTWHRAYLFVLEEALRSIPGCEEVTLPFWDETSQESLTNGVPWALTQPTFELDGATIPNPLYSFTFPLNIKDNLSPIPDADYSKPKGYQTVRYPLSGLVGPGDIEATKAHNAKFPDPAVNAQLLSQNVVNWLTSSIVIDGKVISRNVHAKYVACLDAPNYTVFSNTTSAAEWNTNAPAPVVALESPHNSIHLAVGGFDLPNVFNASPIPGANGDMGENDTAGLDPIFFFHHCHVDRVFWLWQQRHAATDGLEIIPQFPGTNSVDNQGPTPGTPANSWLTLDSPLDPFKKDDQGTLRPYTSRDCVNIETQLGYTYAPGSLQDLDAERAISGLAVEPEADATGTDVAAPVVHVSGINRAAIRGSFLISTFVTVDGERHHVDSEAVLSRWHVTGCANCQTHLQARTAVSLRALGAKQLSAPEVEVEVHTRDGLLGGRAASPHAAVLAAGATRTPFRVEIR
ncbi:MAG TPA: tyrosinase family protein [Longimicrobium sp.]|jgi:tyrosinase